MKENENIIYDIKNTQIRIMDIDIYIVDVLTLKKYKEVLFKNLSFNEKEKSFTLKDYKTRELYILRKSIVRLIISLYTKEKPNELMFCYNCYGKPYLKEKTLYFNISHSKKYLAVAISEKNEIGVDIQVLKKKDNISYLLSDILTDEEKIMFDNLPQEDKNYKFYVLWTRKEAVSKAIGKGIISNFSSFSVKNSYAKVGKKNVIVKSWNESPSLFCSIAEISNNS